MQTKLTLRLDHHVIEEAKIFARHQNKSLSRLVEEYFRLLMMSVNQETDHIEEDLPPITKSLLGILAESNNNEDDYKRYLEEKYL